MTDPYITAGHIRTALHTIQANYEPALTGTAPRDDSDARPQRATAPPPVSPHILDVRADTYKSLRVYARYIKLVVNNGTISATVEPTIAAMCQFTDIWALQLAEQHPHYAARCSSDLGYHAERLRKIVNGEYTSRMVIAKICPVPIWQGELIVRCTGTLIAYVQHGDAPLPPGVRCDTNAEHAWAPHEWPTLGRRLSA
jgi:hypothetical protein